MTFLLAGYGVWLAAYLFWEKRRSQRLASQADEQPPAQQNDEPDIVGKSSFRMKLPTPTPATPVPNAATSEKDEEIRVEDVTFDSETGNKPSARIPDSELDSVFTDLRIEDVTEDEDEGDEEAPVEGYATQSDFEEINEAVITAKNPEATEEARLQAGKVFSGLDGTELFGMMKERLSSVSGRITELMNAYLDNPAIGATEEERLIIPAHAEDFDIRDYV